jgi:hypothetical protein
MPFLKSPFVDVRTGALSARYSSKRFSSLVEDREILLVDKQTVALAAGDLTQNAKLPHVLQRFCDSRS